MHLAHGGGQIINELQGLALHRIISAKATSNAFIRPKDFDLQKYDDYGRFGFGEGKRMRLSFCIKRGAVQHLLESPLSSDQQVVERNDGLLEISATVVDSAMLEWWLRGFGDALEVLEHCPVCKAV